MTFQELVEQIKEKQSFLCIGLDADLSKIPKHLLRYQDPVAEFNRQIVNACEEFCVAFKPNTAFYEASGVKGWQTLQTTFEFLPKNCFSIADAKRGDIGNTSAAYAKAFFDLKNSGFNFDAVTVAPYMGADSVKPFLTFENKWVILLALTSNDSASDFQLIENNEGEKIYQQVLKTASVWGGKEQLMFVIGATRPEYLIEVRKIVPENFLLVPGVGAQGGSLQEVAKYGMNQHIGLLVNASRSIIFASDREDFAEAARMEAKKIQLEMKILLETYHK